MSIVRLPLPEISKIVQTAILTLEHLFFHRTSIHRLAELFVQPMINTGAERERFKEIVQQVGDSLQYMDKVQISSKEGNYEDVSHLIAIWFTNSSLI